MNFVFLKGNRALVDDNDDELYVIEALMRHIVCSIMMCTLII